MRTLGPGDFFGELAMLGKVPRTATATAVTPATLLVLADREFTTLLADHPGIQQKVLKMSPAGSPHRFPSGRPSAPTERAPLSAGSFPSPPPHAAHGGPDPHRHRGRAERVADVLVGAGLGEDQAADRPVAEDERAAAVTALDLGAQLEDVPPDLLRRRRCRARRDVGAGDGGRHDRQVAARVAERRPDRAAIGVGAGERSGRGPQVASIEQRDVELGVEQHDGRIDQVAPAAATRTLPPRTRHDMRVGHDVAIGDHHPTPRRREAAGPRP